MHAIALTQLFVAACPTPPSVFHEPIKTFDTLESGYTKIYGNANGKVTVVSV